MKHVFFIIIAFLLIGSPVQAAEILNGIKGADDRLTMPSDEFPWRAIGRVNNETGAHCTGVIVGPSLVVTASHCLFDKRKMRFVPAEQVHFVAGYRDWEFIAHTTATSYFIPKGYDEKARPSAKTAQHDWAFVQLKEEIGYKTGWFGVENLTINRLGALMKADTVFIQAGYSKDKKNELTAHIGCPIEGFANDINVMVHRCDAVPGDSGSPIFYLKGGFPVLVGIHVATTKKSRPVRGISVPTSTFIEGVASKGSIVPAPPVKESDGQLEKTATLLLEKLGYGKGSLLARIQKFETDHGLSGAGRISHALLGQLVVALKGKP